MLPQWNRRRPAPSRLHHWAVAVANTADGVRARLTVDFTARVPADSEMGADRDEALSAVVELVEAALRSEIAARPVAELPSAGDTPGWALSELPVEIEHAVVTTADVEVSAELRRLVGGRSGPPAWT